MHRADDRSAGRRRHRAAQEQLKITLEDWIPKILAAQEPDGYLQTAFTLDDGTERWSPRFRADHEGYVAGYFLESAINHYMLTDGTDRRLYDAAKKLADCWVANIGPAPKKEWYDGHQEMEQALVRFGRFVNDMEGNGAGDDYIQLAKFLLDSRARRQRVRPEPRARAAAVRGRRPRGARRLHLLRHGRRRRGDGRSRLPERRDVALGQHRQQEVLRHRRHRQRRDLRRLRPELLAAQQRLLRILLELRPDLLPVQDEPGLPRREVRRPVRGDDVQRAARLARSGGQELLLHQSARLGRAAVCRGTSARAASATSRARC